MDIISTTVNVLGGALLIDKEREKFASEFWLIYFNDYLYANGLITEDERNKMSNLISRPTAT